jgi:phage terminase large subunit
MPVFKPTTALHKISALRKRIRGVSGGTSASKTISILMWLIDYAQTHPNELISVVSESFPHLKRGAIRDFLMIMNDAGYFKDSLWNRTDYTYTFESGTKMEFFSADQPGKVRGPRRDVLFMNEANNIGYETYTQLEVRTKKIVWIDHNPVSEYWWYDEVMKNNDVDFLTLTYKDNESLAQSIVESIESRKGNKQWWRVYGLGLLGEVEGKIYTDWKVIDEVPHEARLVRYGVDFGYSNDPTAIIAIYEYNQGYILDEVCYQKGMSNKMIADLLNNLPKALVIADSAEPKSIDEIKSYGINILGATKGQGSVSQGIGYVQQQRISVTKSSTNTIRAYRNYMWIIDKDGKIINVPDDSIHEWSNSMDAIRYGFDSLKPKTERKPHKHAERLRLHL